MMGPFTGAFFAGFASWAHSAALIAFGPEAAVKPLKAEIKGNDDNETKPLL